MDLWPRMARRDCRAVLEQIHLAFMHMHVGTHRLPKTPKKGSLTPLEHHPGRLTQVASVVVPELDDTCGDFQTSRTPKPLKHEP